MRDTRVGTIVRHCPSTGETRLTKKGDTYTSVRGTWLAAEFDVGDCVSFLELVNFYRRVWNLLLHSSNATPVANPTAIECAWHGSTARVSDLYLAPTGLYVHWQPNTHPCHATICWEFLLTLV